MPYDKMDELPDRVRDNLPEGAQKIFMEAFNSAWDQYEDREETVNRVAWSAVKKKYQKKNGEWKRKED